MHAGHQPRKNTNWNTAWLEQGLAIRAGSPPWMRTTPLIIGLSALLWEVVFDLARWLAAFPS